MSDENETPLRKESNFNHWVKYVLSGPVGTAVMGVFLTSVVGGFIGFKYTNMQKEIEYNISQMKESEEKRLSLFSSMSQVLYERKAHLSLLVAALENDAPSDEVKKRWDSYQDSFLRYNLKIPELDTLLIMYLGANSSDPYRKPLQDYITPSFARIDGCITELYYKKIKKDDVNGAPIKARCPLQRGEKPWTLKTEMEELQSCISTYANELEWSVYIEDNFEKLKVKDAKKYKQYQEITSEHFADKKAGKTPKVDAGNWVYYRMLARTTSKDAIEAACSPLVSEMAKPPVK
jgi:hypothetical protein